MTWILMGWIYYNQALATITHEFNSYEACENAGQTFSRKAKNNFYYSEFVCVPKSELSPIR